MAIIILISKLLHEMCLRHSEGNTNNPVEVIIYSASYYCSTCGLGTLEVIDGYNILIIKLLHGVCFRHAGGNSPVSLVMDVIYS